MLFPGFVQNSTFVQSARAVEYTDFTSVEGGKTPPQ